MKLHACMLVLAAVAFGQVPHQNHPPSSAAEYAKLLDTVRQDVPDAPRLADASW